MPNGAVVSHHHYHTTCYESMKPTSDVSPDGGDLSVCLSAYVCEDASLAP